MIKLYLFIFITFYAFACGAMEEWHILRRGNISAKLSSYQDPNVTNYGQQTKAELEQSITFSEESTLLNQLRWLNNSLITDISSKSTPSRQDAYEVYLGENYLKYKGTGFILQVGYQEVVWGESFGFNYADIINPKDRRETILTDANNARLPLLLLNLKKLFTLENNGSGSIQFLYCPEPRFSRTLPIELFIGDQFTQNHFSVIKEKSPAIFKNSEMGGKLALSMYGIDAALFYYSYLDREPSYLLSSANATDLNLKEVHNQVSSSGFSLSKVISDFVLRSDIVLTKDKTINYLSNLNLNYFKTSQSNFLISIDSPNYNNFSGALIFAESHLDEYRPIGTRKQNEYYSILKITKQFDGDKNIELAYTHEYATTGHLIQAFYNLPINNTTELRLGGQSSFGESSSNLNKLKRINSVFFSLKNYFQI